MTEPGRSAGIVGGGIGGFAAALSLLRAGFDVQVYEQASVLSEVGRAFRSARMPPGPCTAWAWPASWRRWASGRLPGTRASRIQALSGADKTRFHLPDGPEQAERDAI